ncbi:MAG: hypothetical protein M3N50_02120 [Pseudomonadota bacterium]|nr:hypothetical protein [Pseudomonadota bacterium]
MQPLPVLTEAQLKLAGPVQPAGKVLNPVVIDKFVADLPSSVVNVTLNAALEPTTTLMALVVEEVATMLSFVGVAEEDPPPPHAANVARLAKTAQRFSNFRVLIIGLSAALMICRLTDPLLSQSTGHEHGRVGYMNIDVRCLGSDWRESKFFDSISEQKVYCQTTAIAQVIPVTPISGQNYARTAPGALGLMRPSGRSQSGVG